jgi:hypothetical protein
MKNYLYFIIVYYIYLSMYEWIGHKYFMHSKEQSVFYKLYSSKSHIKHHIEVENNMRLDKNVSEYTGLIFEWNDLILIFITSYFPIFYLLKKFNFKLNIKRNTMIILLVTCLLYGILWNTLHTLFHNVNISIPIEDGIPEFNFIKEKRNPLILWLYKNHTLHHLIKGENKGNFNIILPGADFIFNTYNSEIDNKTFCKKILKNNKVNTCKVVDGTQMGKEDKLVNLCNNNYSINNFNLN